MTETVNVVDRFTEVYIETIRGEFPHSMGLPRLRFPEVPPDPLGAAINDQLGSQHWHALWSSVDPSPGAKMLDFGCGAADTRGRASALGYQWHGLDIADSQEALARLDRSSVTVYDGLNIPLPDASFDVVLSVQVFEHVQDPALTISEISRILRPGGYLVGSTSHVEPFHSNSTFTYSPAVFAQLLDRNAITPLVVAAGVDGLTIMMRRMIRQFGAMDEAKVFGTFFRDHSPLNEIIDSCGTACQVDPRRINALKLELSGHFHFLARKAEVSPRPTFSDRARLAARRLLGVTPTRSAIS